MSSVLLTGASGFIGRHLLARLRAGHSVIAPVRAELDLLDDQAVRALLRRVKPDVIVHSAVTPGHRNAPKVDGLAARNLRLFFNLAQDADLYGRFVLLGSGSEYDVARMAPRSREEDLGRFIPAEESAASKFALSKFAEGSSRFTILRPFGVYGPGEDLQIRFISNAICKAICGLPITLRQSRRFDYVHVDDLAAVVARFVEAPGRHRSYNVTTDETAELFTIAQKVAAVAGGKVPIQVAQPGLGLEYSGDNARLRAELPQLKFTSLDEGISRLHAHYLEHRGLFSPELLATDK